MCLVLYVYAPRRPEVARVCVLYVLCVYPLRGIVCNGFTCVILLTLRWAHATVLSSVAPLGTWVLALGATRPPSQLPLSQFSRLKHVFM